MKKSIATLVCLTILLTTFCLSLVSCQREAPRAVDRPEPALQPPSVGETPTAEQKQLEAAKAQEQLRAQAEADRQQRVNELMERAKAYQRHQQYEESLGQLEALLTIDPLNDEALTLKEMEQDVVLMRKQIEIDQLARRQRVETLRDADKASVPYADEITYPKNWREMMQKPTQKPEAPVPPSANQPAQSMSNSDSNQAQPRVAYAVPPGSVPGSGGMGMGGMGGYGGNGMMGGMGGFGGGPGGYERTMNLGWQGQTDSIRISRGSDLPVVTRRPGQGQVLFQNPSSAARVAGQLPAEWLTVSEDEIWVIARPEGQRPQATGPEYSTPGSGAMLAQIKQEQVPLPLKHTDVKGNVCGYIATVEVVQQFQNPFGEKIEAVYVFPLPQNAAVNEFIMVIGDRRIRGIIRERQEAEQIYRQARQQGYVASLLTEERPNIFTQKVANIEPGKQIDVHIKYFSTLAYADGWYEFTFPMVVGPRFNPPCSTDGVGAVGRGKPGLSGQATEVQYLKPNERSGHDIALALDLDAGVKIEEIACASHAIVKSYAGSERASDASGERGMGFQPMNHRQDADATKPHGQDARATVQASSEKVHVQLSPLDSIPNKDFVLRFRVAGDTIKSALVTHRDERGGFFSLMLYPPADLQHVQQAPMEMVFVLDCSGSMNGQPIAKSKEAVKRALRKLGPDDTFQVIRFSNSASQLGPNPVPATPESVERAIAYIDGLQGEGGTMMIEGIKAALDFPHDPRRFRLVSFMTDGYIGNEAEILGEIHNRLGDTRIFSFGIGSSVNRYLLDRMAKLGKGAVAYIGLNDSGTETVDRFYDCVRHPALTDVRIDWGDLQVSEVYPRQIPDLFVGRPIVLTGRFKGTAPTTIRVAGRVGQSEKEIRLPVEFETKAPTHPGLACVWARKRIEDLYGRIIIRPYETNPDLPAEIKQVALQYGLMSSYTAFVAVDATQTTQGDHGVTVAVPVPVPDGVRYDTTVQD